MPVSIDYDPRTGSWQEQDGVLAPPPRHRCGAYDEGFALGAGRCVASTSGVGVADIVIVDSQGERVLVSHADAGYEGGMLVGGLARGDETILLLVNHGLELLRVNGHDVTQTRVDGPDTCSNATMAARYGRGFLVVCDTLQENTDTVVLSVSPDGDVTYFHPRHRMSAAEMWIDDHGHVRGSSMLRTDMGAVALRVLPALTLVLALVALVVAASRRRVHWRWAIGGALVAVVVTVVVTVAMVWDGIQHMNVIPFG